MKRCAASVVLALILIEWFAGELNAQPPTVQQILPDNVTLEDHRSAPLKDLDGFFPFDVPATRAEWEQRSSALQRRILVSNGLWPLPEKTPLNAVIHGRIERDGFTVEKVYFESLPGFFVTGLLFRPVGKAGPFPAVLCPHGHGGRLQDAGEQGILQQIAKGEERFAESGRFPKLARCAQLARMGCVVMMHDMIGYADNTQLSFELAHRFAKQRPEMEGSDAWGFYSTPAELRCQSIMGLQTWNCIRALDFLCGLPDVDSARIGVTGGSGGGTQTILLCAIDARPVVAFPQGMVSTSMQGGCTCENCSLLRIGTGNVELAALFAPRPQAMTAANDWTKDMMTSGFPELRKLYALVGRADNVACTPLLQFPHNYNYPTRALMYDWFNQHLGLSLQEPIVEQDYPLLSLEEQTVWNAEHPQPPARGDQFERELVASLTQQSDQQLAKLQAAPAAAEYQTIVGGAVETILGRTLDDVRRIERTKLDKIDRGDHWRFHDLLTLTDQDEQVLAVSLYPKTADWNGSVVLWITGDGKSGLFRDGQTPHAVVQGLLAKGYSVLAADLFGQGESTAGGVELTDNRVVANPREFAGYTFGYNHSLFAQRVHDVLTLIAWVRGGEHNVKSVHLVGTNGMGPIAAAASAVSHDGVTGLAVDLNGFRFRHLKSYRDENFLPGIVKYGDLPALLSLSEAQRLLVLDSESPSELVTRTFPGERLLWTAPSADAPSTIAEWLTRN
ncbi:MAG: acetylxylan esterase [Planctomycetaceae bacterium]|nr:acetylxylan esterase [Planctomycetaceae bacterium]